MTQILPILKSNRSMLETIGNLVLSKTLYPIFITLVLIFSLKNGIRGVLPWADFSPVENFPQPTRTLSSSSVGLLAISKLFLIETKISYFLLNLILLFIFLNVFYWFVSKKFSKNIAVLLFLLFFSSPISVVLFGNVGRHDLLTVFGMLFFFLSKNNAQLLCSVAFQILGSPEHSIAAYFLLFVASLFKIVQFRRQATIALTVSFIYFIGIQLWLHNSDEGTSRFLEIFPMMDLALRNSLNNGHLELFSYLGYFWFSSILAIWMIHKHRIVLVILITFPILFNLIMVDKTRDYVIAIIPLIIALHIEIFGSAFSELDKRNIRFQEMVVGGVLLVSLILPSLEVTFEGIVRSPYSWFWSKTI